jgi:hypothetical protein
MKTRGIKEGMGQEKGMRKSSCRKGAAAACLQRRLLLLLLLLLAALRAASPTHLNFQTPPLGPSQYYNQYQFLFYFDFLLFFALGLGQWQ